MFLFSILGIGTGPSVLGKLARKTGNWEKLSFKRLKSSHYHVLRQHNLVLLLCYLSKGQFGL